MAALKHYLLRSTGWDLGIFDQVAWQISQGLEPRTLGGWHFMADHGAWMFYGIAPLYWLAPSVQWLFLTQALGLILTAWPLWHLAAQAGLQPRERWLVCGLWWLQPVVFNVNLWDFHPETWAMPLLVLAIWANRGERFRLWLLCLFLFMGCRDGLALIVIGLALEQAMRRRWLWAAAALVLGGGWLLFLVKTLYPSLSNMGTNALIGAISGRYQHICQDECKGIGHILRSALLDPIHLLSALNWPNIIFYLILLSLPLGLYWRQRSLPLLVATLPLLASNILSNTPTQLDLLHHYPLPLAVLLVIASMDGLVADQKQGRLWLTRRLWFCCFWAALCFALLAKRSHSLGYHFITEINTVQPAHALVKRIPADAAVLTHNHLAPHLSQRPVVKLLSSHQPLNPAELNAALLDRKTPWDGATHRATATAQTAATIVQLQEVGWVCEEESSFVLCQKY